MGQKAADIKGYSRQVETSLSECASNVVLATVPWHLLTYLYYSILIYTYLISLKSPIYQEPLQALCVYELDRLRAQPLHGFVTKQIEDPQKSLRSKVGFPLLYISLHPAEKEGWIVSHTHILGHFCCHVLENLMPPHFIAISVQVAFYEFMTHCPVIYTAQPEKGETLSPFIHSHNAGQVSVSWICLSLTAP